MRVGQIIEGYKIVQLDADPAHGFYGCAVSTINGGHMFTFCAHCLDDLTKEFFSSLEELKEWAS